MSALLSTSEINAIQIEFKNVQQILDAKATTKPLTTAESAILQLSCSQSKTSIVLSDVRHKLATTENKKKYKFWAPKILLHILPMIAQHHFTSLDLSYTKLTIKSIKILTDSIVAGCTGLTYLDISATGLTDEGSEVIMKAIQTQPQLTSLSMKSNKLTNHGTAVLASLLSSTHIKILDVSATGDQTEQILYALTDNVWNFSITKNKTLGTTNVAWSQSSVEETKETTEDVTKKPIVVVGTSSVSTLTLSHTSNCNFSMLKNASSCTSLHLRCVDIAQKDDIASIHASNVAELSLIQCKLSSNCMKSFITNLSTSNIKILNLSYSNLSAQRMNDPEFNIGEMLLNHLPCSKIESLDMMYCSLQDSFLKSMVDAVLQSKLLKLNLKGNQFTNVGISLLAPMLGSVKCLLTQLCFQNGFAPERPSLTIGRFDRLKEQNQNEYVKRWKNADRSDIAPLFIKHLSERKTPTPLTVLRGVALNLSSHLGQNSGKEDFVFHAGLKDAHRIAGQDNGTILKYLHLAHFEGNKRRAARNSKIRVVE